MRVSSRACSLVCTSGLSQITWKPASANALATGKCRWFGVTMLTASMRSPSGSDRSFSSISSQLP